MKKLSRKSSKTTDRTTAKTTGTDRNSQQFLSALADNIPLRFFVSFAGFLFLLNFFWESLHGLLYLDHQVMPAGSYVPMMLEMAGYDTLAASGFYLFMSRLNNALVWPLTLRNAALFSSIALIVACATEYVAVHILHQWAYRPSMPALFGIGIFPLVQLAATGLLGIFLASRITAVTIHSSEQSFRPHSR